MSEAWCFMMASGPSSNVQSAQVCASLIIDVCLKSLFTCGGWYETCPVRCLVNSFTEYAQGIHSTIINHHSSPLDRGWVKSHILIVYHSIIFGGWTLWTSMRYLFCVHSPTVMAHLALTESFGRGALEVPPPATDLGSVENPKACSCHPHLP